MEWKRKEEKQEYSGTLMLPQTEIQSEKDSLKIKSLKTTKKETEAL